MQFEPDTPVLRLYEHPALGALPDVPVRFAAGEAVGTVRGVEVVVILGGIHA